MLRERIMSGLRRTTKNSGRKPMPDDRAEAIRTSLLDGQGIRATARLHRASTTMVTAIKRSLESVEQAVLGDRCGMTDDVDKPVAQATPSPRSFRARHRLPHR